MTGISLAFDHFKKVSVLERIDRFRIRRSKKSKNQIPQNRIFRTRKTFEGPDRPIQLGQVVKNSQKQTFCPLTRSNSPPDNLGMEYDNITRFARTDFRSTNRVFGIKNEDRMLHVYAIGK